MRVIISGAAGGGKSTLINHLKKEGFHCHDEVSREIIKQQINTEGKALPWEDMRLFGELVFGKMSAELKSSDSNLLCYYDRGIPDIIAYLKYEKLPIPLKYYQEMIVANYCKTVFIAPPWEDIYINDNERPESFSLSEDRYQFVIQTYQSLGFEIQVLPCCSVVERGNLIKSIINEKSLVCTEQ